MLIPTVKLLNKEGYTDILSALLEQRIIIVEGEITSELAMSINAQLLYLASKSDETIELYINSPGGSVTAGLSICDIISHIKPDVATVCCGQACSMGAVIFSCGTKGKRFVYPHSEIMLHQPSTGFAGRESDIQVVASHIKRTKDALLELLISNTGQSRKTLEKDTERDYYLNSKEALAYGIADCILDE